MIIYIASSWKNQHAVELLTMLLRTEGHEVKSFVDNNKAEKGVNFEQWVHTEDATRCFEYDTTWATNSDLLIYVGPSGQDAWAEVGAAWGAGRPEIIGLYAKGEGVGLMRKMIPVWYENYREVLHHVQARAT